MSRPETSLRDLVGEQFGPYKLVRRLGIGGMAETFEAIRSGPSGFEQRVCIKLVLPFFQGNEDFIELFHREAKLAAKLRHSNIVGVIDFGEVDRKSYMALELVDGSDLRNLLDVQDRKRLSPEHVTLIGLDLAAALEHAHNPDTRTKRAEESGSFTQCIVHRDISPSNVLISRQGEVMLTDFGVAKAITGTARKQSAIKGKIPYMSPEQLKGESVDGRSDLFALGVVMFEALSGQRPFEGPSDPAAILLTLEGKHPSLETLVPNAPTELCEVIESLLQPDAEKRPQVAGELIEALDDLTPSRRTRRTLGALVRNVPTSFEVLGPNDSSAVGKSTAGLPTPDEEKTGVGHRKRRARDKKGATAPVDEAALLAEREEVPKLESRRRAWVMFAGAALLIAGIAGIGLFQSSKGADEVPFFAGTVPMSAPEERAVETAAPAPPEEEPVAEASLESEALDPEPAEAAPVETAKPERRPKATPVSAAPARLTVIAIPWGSVWINGKSEGSSPLKNKSMKPGRYEVAAGQGGPTKTQTIRLRPGQRKTVKFDLTE